MHLTTAVSEAAKTQTRTVAVALLLVVAYTAGGIVTSRSCAYLEFYFGDRQYLEMTK